MIKYAKLEDGRIQFPPKNKGAILNYNLNEELLIADGWKKFIEAKREEGKSYNVSYKETEKQIKEILEEIIIDPEEELRDAKQRKAEEASKKAKQAIESGDITYEFEEGKHIEATDGNIAKLTTYSLAYLKGQLQLEDTILWNTKEDENVELTSALVDEIIVGLGAVQANIWTIRFPEIITQIQEAKTVQEVKDIIIHF